MRASRTRRLVSRLGVATALLLVSLAVLTRLASAHHPEVAASATCGTAGVAVRWTAVAWQTNNADHRVNHDVRVLALLGTAWQEIGRGNFSAANNYQFTGTYDLPAAVTGTLTLKVTNIPRWGEAENYGSGGEYRQTDVTVPTGCNGGGGVACGGNLGVAGDYNLFVRGNVSLRASDVGGRVAVGGDATFASFAVGSDITASSARVDLAVDGTLTGTGGVQVSSGSVTYGAQLVGAVSAPRGVITNAKAPFVADTFAALYASTADWAKLAPNGDVTWSATTPRTLTLTGTDPTLVVWSLTAADLQTARQIRVQAPTTAALLVNVTGAAYDTNQAGLTSISFWNGTGFAQYGYPSTDATAVAYRTHLLWNFPTATSLQFGPSLSWEGSVLAPYAAVTLPGGAFNGGLMAAGASAGTSAVSTELHPYAANPPCLPPSTATTTATTAGTGTTLPAPPTTISPYCATYGDLSGTVFEDHDANGVFDTGGTARAADRGVAGVTVRAFDASGATVGSAVSGADGTWHIAVVASSSRDVRVEFSTLPAGYLPGSVTTTGGAVQFVSLCSENVDFAVQIPSHYCQDNPDLAVTCQRRGDTTKPVVMTQKWQSGWDVTRNGSKAPTAAAEYDTGYPDASGGTAGHPVATPAGDVGSVSGLAWRPSTRTLYAAAYVKRGAVMGPAGPSAVYAVPVASDGTGTAARLAFRLPAGAGGSPALGADGTPSDFDAAGRYALGGMTLLSDPADPAGDALYVPGLADRRLYRITDLDAAAPTITPIEVPLTLPGAAQGCPAADLVPFGITSWNGVVYLALTCTGESTRSAGAVRAYVYAYTPGAGWSSAPRIEIPLTYQRGELDYFSSMGARQPDNHWIAWTNDLAAHSNQALVTDLAIAEGAGTAAGDLVIGVRTRTGDNQVQEMSSGDLLYATPGGPGWVLEPGLTPTTHSEHFRGDGWPFSLTDGVDGGGHFEATSGGVATVPGFPHVAATQRTALFTNGIVWHDVASGRVARALSLYSSPDNSVTDTFGKNNSLGDLAALCDQAPIEVGDRVWADADGDGVQDVGEFGLPGVEVELHAANGTLVATTTTDGMGQYVFRGLTPRTAYTVSVALGQAALTVKGYRDAPALQGASRALDSDAVRSGNSVVAAFTTGAPGQNDHDVDIGLAGPPGDRPKCACATTTTTIVEPPPGPAPSKPTYVSP